MLEALITVCEQYSLVETKIRRGVEAPNNVVECVKVELMCGEVKKRFQVEE